MAQVTATPGLEEDAEKPRKTRLVPLLAGIFGAAILGSGGFYVAYSGLLPISGDNTAQPAAIAQDFAFIPIERITVSLPADMGIRHLQFSGQIEVASQSHKELMRLHPRFVDVIHTYLRAVDPQDLADPAALIRLRAQILRRLQIVAGQGHVRDFLITEFILG